MENRPNIKITNKEEKTCTLIDVEIPADRNFIQKKAENKIKYTTVHM
jgi:hypothetical protein